ncbi:MAG: hypothetical protein KJZ93_07415 [Caldilineaceae bacterium]|nr:hypothetical protein [Caldilineaceae bacterium]
MGYVTFSIRPKPGIASGTVVKNQASIVFDTNEPIITNEVDNLVGEAVDLVVQGSVASPLVAGRPAALSFTVINDGPDTAELVRFTLSPVTGATLVILSASQGACSGDQCQLGSIAAGGRVELTASLQVSGGDHIEVRGSATTNTIEVNPVDNQALVRQQVAAAEGGHLYLPIVSK